MPSAIMTVTTARAAGVRSIVARPPARSGVGIPPAMLFTMKLCGTDRFVNLGGVRGVAAMAFGTDGPNRALRTSGAGRYTGGLSVHKYMKTVTWQRVARDGVRPVAEAAARISRVEGMLAHEGTADIRLGKFFSGRTFHLSATE